VNTPLDLLDPWRVAGYNDGNFLPDNEHPWNIGPCTDPNCGWDVYAPEPDSDPIHFACHMNQHRKDAA
jgi:hypothetical protein